MPHTSDNKGHYTAEELFLIYKEMLKDPEHGESERADNVLNNDIGFSYATRRNRSASTTSEICAGLSDNRLI